MTYSTIPHIKETSDEYPESLDVDSIRRGSKAEIDINVMIAGIKIIMKPIEKDFFMLDEPGILS